MIRWHLVFIEYGVDRANGLAVAAVDTDLGIDVIHLFCIVGGDATHRTYLYARRVFNPDAGLGDNESQNILLMELTGRTSDAPDDVPEAFKDWKGLGPG